jgi:hypothetical protein
VDKVEESNRFHDLRTFAEGPTLEAAVRASLQSQPKLKLADGLRGTEQGCQSSIERNITPSVTPLPR